MTVVVVIVIWFAASFVVAAVWAVHGLRTTRKRE